jgi:hypothetical protein
MSNKEPFKAEAISFKNTLPKRMNYFETLPSYVTSELFPKLHNPMKKGNNFLFNQKTAAWGPNSDDFI